MFSPELFIVSTLKALIEIARKGGVKSPPFDELVKQISKRKRRKD